MTGDGRPRPPTLEDERDLLFYEMQRLTLGRAYDDEVGGGEGDGYESGVLCGDDIEYERLNARYLRICERIAERDGERW